MGLGDVSKRIILGRKLRSSQADATLLPKRVALPVFASDGAPAGDPPAAGPLAELAVHRRAETPLSIGIFGPAGSGKSTTARRAADRLGWLYLDTGAMYRAVGLAFG